MNKEKLLAVLLIVFLVVLIVVAPLLTITALNILFPSLAIPYSIWTWFAVAWLQFVTVGTRALKGK